MEVLNSFIVNITDVYHPIILNKFIEHGNAQKINIDMMLSHNITKLNMLFCKVWNVLFDTYPCKKQFQDYLFSITPIDNAYTSTIQIYDDAVLQSIINFADIQTVCRYGFVPQSEYEKVKQVFKQTVGHLNDKAYVKAFLIDKWKFRFNNDLRMSDEFIKQNQPPNLLKSFVTLFKNKVRVDNVDLPNIEHFSGFTPEADGNPVELTSMDRQYMEPQEVFQYLLHKNNRFLMQLATHVVIVNTVANNTEIESLTEVIHEVVKKNIVVINLAHDGVAERFTYNIPTSYFHLMPRMASQCIVMSDVVVKRPLCKSTQNSTFLLLGDCYDKDMTPKDIDLSSYDLTLTHDVVSDPSKHMFHLPSPTHSLYKWAWKHYLALKCPFTTPHSMNNTLIFVDFISKYCVQKEKTLFKTIQRQLTKQHKLQQNTNTDKHCIVLVDTRYNIMSLWAVLISLYNAIDANIKNLEWTAIIYTTRTAALEYKEQLQSLGLTDTNIDNIIKIEICPSLECKVFHMEVYNTFLKDEQFWKRLQDQGFQKCLVVQDDGMLVNSDNLDEYIKYDYVGAPWADAQDNTYIKKYINSDLVGNGGFSMRDVAKSYQVCCTFQKEKNELFYHNINEIPEDVYFVKCFKKMGDAARVAPFALARRFSVEQVFQHKPCGFHKFWVYQRPQDALRLCDSWL